jgi:hypothetical protein
LGQPHRDNHSDDGIGHDPENDEENDRTAAQLEPPPEGTPRRNESATSEEQEDTKGFECAESYEDEKGLARRCDFPGSGEDCERNGEDEDDDR